jgi:hypothetical protein
MYFIPEDGLRTVEDGPGRDWHIIISLASTPNANSGFFLLFFALSDN